MKFKGCARRQRMTNGRNRFPSSTTLILQVSYVRTHASLGRQITFVMVFPWTLTYTKCSDFCLFLRSFAGLGIDGGLCCSINLNIARHHFNLYTGTADLLCGSSMPLLHVLYEHQSLRFRL